MAAVISVLLIFCSLVGGFFGLVFSSQATGGVALIAASCLLAILARMAQASIHHADAMRSRTLQVSPAEPPAEP